MFEYYLPGVDHKSLTDEEFNTKLAHLAVIRKRERIIDKVFDKDIPPI